MLEMNSHSSSLRLAGVDLAQAVRNRLSCSLGLCALSSRWVVWGKFSQIARPPVVQGDPTRAEAYCRNGLRGRRGSLRAAFTSGVRPAHISRHAGRQLSPAAALPPRNPAETFGGA